MLHITCLKDLPQVTSTTNSIKMSHSERNNDLSFEKKITRIKPSRMWQI